MARNKAPTLDEAFASVLNLLELKAQADAERTLAAAPAYYLDERFGITDGQKLGWLKNKTK